MTDAEAIERVIDREGGYVDNPADSGGPTRFGITQATLASWRGHDVTPEDVRIMSRDEARLILTERYLVEPGIGRIRNPDLRLTVLDAAVHHGPRQAIRMLQRAAAVPDDGVIGNVTLAALPALDGRKMALRFLAERTRFFGRIISGNLTDADKDGIPDNAEFAAGWCARIADQIEALT
jgi:lysozyme family protein